jgi:Flp pilus assembly protein TadG
MRSSASSDHRGQAVVELALVLPLVCMLALGIVQVGLIVIDQLAVHHAAREAARAAAVSATPSASARRAVTRFGMSPSEVVVTATSTAVDVTIRVRSPTDVPFVGMFIPDAVLSSSVVMAREPP